MMRKLGRSLTVLLTVGVLMLSFVLSSCTKHPNEEQLKALEETKKAALSAEDQLAAKKQEKSRVERQLAEKKQKAAETKKEKEKVCARVQGQ